MTAVAVALHSPNARLGIAVMLLGIFMFALNDTLGKWLVATYSVGQVLLIRSIAALVVLSPLIWRMGWRPLVTVERPGMQALRVALSSIEVYAFYFAVIYLPLADVMTYWLAAPIYVAALSPFLLGEQVGWRRWTAIFIGFVGVIIALEPSAATLTAPALISIFGSFCFAFMMLSGRALRGTPDKVLVFWQIVGAGLLGLVTAPFGWVQPSAFDLALLAGLGVVAMVAHVCVNRAMKLADAAVVAPFQYTLLFWAVVFGFIVFGDAPRPAMLAGAAVIIAAGLFIFFREHRAKKGS
ncbi:MAG: DMT family transporter [Hoeflea sp.]|uniref:DMT family transporter n=1 Tax=Hoeflea sp. TaxID=1940281 RepID=UPI001DBCC586|nr:DMT family transporter [Hoeflea sp.]MBU4530989.1 DMT family transporter [Alphaproteobacteria bacterium]MBU4542764.1 DMT family transporter [Alphaproteobacteria bacterium]MBU4552576.1 DMT family transporter [Alphaproteobacteria bacterium]MBV1722881.1 DMT family transporter [Hoeflea sp.]MBV1762792.1 DMT family transporter [Hoeflea sp.]